jgi:putative membrane protein
MNRLSKTLTAVTLTGALAVGGTAVSQADDMPDTLIVDGTPYKKKDTEGNYESINEFHQEELSKARAEAIWKKQQSNKDEGKQPAQEENQETPAPEEDQEQPTPDTPDTQDQSSVPDTFTLEGTTYEKQDNGSYKTTDKDGNIGAVPADTAKFDWERLQLAGEKADQETSAGQNNNGNQDASNDQDQSSVPDTFTFEGTKYEKQNNGSYKTTDKDGNIGAVPAEAAKFDWERLQLAEEKADQETSAGQNNNGNQDAPETTEPEGDSETTEPEDGSETTEPESDSETTVREEPSDDEFDAKKLAWLALPAALIIGGITWYLTHDDKTYVKDEARKNERPTAEEKAASEQMLKENKDEVIAQGGTLAEGGKVAESNSAQGSNSVQSGNTAKSNAAPSSNPAQGNNSTQGTTNGAYSTENARGMAAETGNNSIARGAVALAIAGLLAAGAFIARRKFFD